MQPDAHRSGPAKPADGAALCTRCPLSPRVLTGGSNEWMRSGIACTRLTASTACRRKPLNAPMSSMAGRHSGCAILARVHWPLNQPIESEKSPRRKAGVSSHQERFFTATQLPACGGRRRMPVHCVSVSAPSSAILFRVAVDTFPSGSFMLGVSGISLPRAADSEPANAAATFLMVEFAMKSPLMPENILRMPANYSSADPTCSTTAGIFATDISERATWLSN